MGLFPSWNPLENSPLRKVALRGSWDTEKYYFRIISALNWDKGWEKPSMDQCLSWGKLLTNFQRHWSIRISLKTGQRATLPWKRYHNDAANDQEPKSQEEIKQRIRAMIWTGFLALHGLSDILSWPEHLGARIARCHRDARCDSNRTPPNCKRREQVFC